jgi:prepilin-type N-terminal cleavage/methylation domain-containing protein
MVRCRGVIRTGRSDSGFTLVEAVVSMVILALLSTGIIAGTNMIVRMTADNRSRQIAVNIAEQQLDTDRGILDPFNVHPFGGTSPNPAATQTVSGRTYTTTQATSLVSVDGNDISCGSGSTIYYRRISVTVDWTGRLATTTPVESDTILSPNGRINDASTGSIAVQVTGAAGTGESGVSVSVAPVSGTATALQSQPSATDVDGCSYALGVTPGTYKVSISRSASVDTSQVAAPSNATVTVVAGATYPVNFTYDQSGTFAVTYPTGATLPTSLPVTFLSPGLPYISPSSSAAPSSASLYPYTAGYTAVAGAEADTNGNTVCAANDPSAWATGAYDGKVLTSGLRGNTAAASPGGAAALTVPMGVFTLNSASAVYLTAVQQSVTTYGQPACTKPQTFAFSALKPNTTTKLALPYGTYTLYSGGALGAQTSLVGSTLNVTPITGSPNGVLTSFSTSASTLTLDPRPGS